MGDGGTFPTAQGDELVDTAAVPAVGIIQSVTWRSYYIHSSHLLMEYNPGWRSFDLTMLTTGMTIEAQA
jgi:hypothetical protein